jgi:integrase
MPYDSSSVRRYQFHPACQALGLPNVGWHTFRHSHRSMLDETGAPVGVQQKLMRHANVSTTMNVYGNASIKAKAEANSKVVQMILKPPA